MRVQAKAAPRSSPSAGMTRIRFDGFSFESRLSPCGHPSERWRG